MPRIRLVLLCLAASAVIPLTACPLPLLPGATPRPAASGAPSATKPGSAPGSPTAIATDPSVRPTPTPNPLRGFAETSPWMSFYGNAKALGDLDRVAERFRVINIDADPGTGNFTKAQITQLKAGGKNRVLSYLNLGSSETFRTYWTKVTAPFEPVSKITAAHLGPYAGYPDETWMDFSNDVYKRLMVYYVAKRLVDQGVDGFYLDNMELVEHRPDEKNGPCSPVCRQAGLEMVRLLRVTYPNMLIVMQNATGPVTRLGVASGQPFPSLLDGIAHEEVYKPSYDAEAESELLAWKALGLKPGGRNFFIGTEDYVGGCENDDEARDAYTKSRAQGFSPYATDESAGQQAGACFWSF